MRREWGAACPPWPVSGQMQDRAAGPEQPPGHTGRKAAGQCCAPRWGWAESPLPARGGTSTLRRGACQVCPSASGLLISSGVMGAPAPPGGGGRRRVRTRRESAAAAPARGRLCDAGPGHCPSPQLLRSPGPRPALVWKMVMAQPWRGRHIVWTPAEAPEGFDGPPKHLLCVSGRERLGNQGISSTPAWGQHTQFSRQTQTRGHCVLC